MLGDISLATNIYLVTGYTDMRKSIDGLCAIIMKNFNTEPDGHSIYLFCGKRCDRIKVLFKEPDGYILLYKRLDPSPGSNSTGSCQVLKLNSRKLYEWLEVNNRKFTYY